jgi:long-chain acyl-CoA synthetase
MHEGSTDGPVLMPSTLAVLPFFISGRFPRPDLMGRCHANGITWTSGRDLVDRVRDVSLGLSSLGMTAGDRVALLSESRPEWVIIDLAILAGGAITTPLYATLSPEQIAFMLRDCGARLLIVSSSEQLDKIRRIEDQVPDLEAIGCLDGEAPPVGARPVLDLTAIAERGHRRIMGGWGVARGFHDDARRVRPEDVATLIYTSGTTGDPKAVQLTHANLISNLRGLQSVLALSDEDVALSFLPLCHAFERTVAYLYLVNGVSMVFAESMDTIARDLLRVRPTLMSGVPRVFEKLLDRIRAEGRSAPWLSRRLFEWAMRRAAVRGDGPHDAGRPGTTRALGTRVADRLVFSRVRDALGGRMRLMVSGSAPLSEEIARVFLGMRLMILEGYGLTETSPVVTVNPPHAIRFGTVGKPLPDIDVRVTEDGEILVRGPNVMAGYYRRPEDSAAVLRDGWFHTGDIGELTADGYLRVTDRKKDLLVTSGGKKIAPQPIEAALRAHPLVAEAMIIGDGRRFPAALMVPDFAALARQLHVPAPVDEAGRRALIERSDVREMYQAVVDAVNAPLAQFERIKHVALLPARFSIDSGELTATLKVKRRVVEERYRDVVEAIYR